MTFGVILIMKYKPSSPMDALSVTQQVLFERCPSLNNKNPLGIWRAFPLESFFDRSFRVPLTNRRRAASIAEVWDP